MLLTFLCLNSQRSNAFWGWCKVEGCPVMRFICRNLSLVAAVSTCKEQEIRIIISWNGGLQLTSNHLFYSRKHLDSPPSGRLDVHGHSHSAKRTSLMTLIEHKVKIVQGWIQSRWQGGTGKGFCCNRAFMKHGHFEFNPGMLQRGSHSLRNVEVTKQEGLYTSMAAVSRNTVIKPKSNTIILEWLNTILSAQFERQN